MDKWFELTTHLHTGSSHRIACTSLVAEVSIVHVVADVRLATTFVNKSLDPLEVTYESRPLPLPIPSAPLQLILFYKI